MNDNEETDIRTMYGAFEAALRQALQPVIDEITGIRAQLAATNQRNEVGTPPPELDEITSIRARARQPTQ